MDILVSDTNIFIDLYNCGLIHKLFELPFGIHTVDLVLHELKDPDQRKVLENYEESNQLHVKTLVDGDELSEVLKYKVGKAAGSNLSITDCAVIWYTLGLGGAKLLTGDKKLRSHAEKEGLDVSGIFYLFDLFVELGFLPEDEAIRKLLSLYESNPRLPEVEIDKRIEKWSAR